MADGSLIRAVVYPLNQPNGVGLSPDRQTVYVAETSTGHLWAYDILSPGVVRLTPPHGGRYLAGPPGFKSWDSLALEATGNLCIATLVYGGITTMAPDGQFVEFLPLPDPLTTNICFGGKDMRTAYITLSGSGRLVTVPWPREGLGLNHTSRQKH